MHLCPTCRQELPECDLVISLDSNTAVAHGRFVELTPDQAVIAYQLRRGYPHTVTYQSIKHAVWGKGPSIPAEWNGLMRTQIYRLRKRLQPVGYGIVVVWNEGFRLVDQGNPNQPGNIHTSATMVAA